MSYHQKCQGCILVAYFEDTHTCWDCLQNAVSDGMPEEEEMKFAFKLTAGADEQFHQAELDGALIFLYPDQKSNPMCYIDEGDRKLYFWYAETWNHLYGPYYTEEMAKRCLAYYAKHML